MAALDIKVDEEWAKFRGSIHLYFLKWNSTMMANDS
jgi:hypothetical protein